MKILKKNQIVISVIALMLVAAGYLNYSSQVSQEVSSKEAEEQYDYAGIGDAKLVDSEEIVGEENTIKETMANSMQNQQNEKIDEPKDNNTEKTVETNANETSNDYFTSSRLERDKMYSEMLEAYQKILQNASIAESQKSISSKEVANINNTKNAIMIAENLIKTKGFEDVVIFVNDSSVSIVVKAEKLEQNQIAQIQNIISRELNAEISNIHISTK